MNEPAAALMPGKAGEQPVGEPRHALSDEPGYSFTFLLAQQAAHLVRRRDYHDDRFPE